MRKVKVARQVKAVERMIAARGRPPEARPPEQDTDYKLPKSEEHKGGSLTLIVKFECEKNQWQEKCKHAEEDCRAES